MKVRLDVPLLAALALGCVPLTGFSSEEPAVTSFEGLVKQCKAAFADVHSEVVRLPSSTDKPWVKRVTSMSDLRYDVRKTDSLVSPIVGQITLKTMHANGVAVSEEAASALAVDFEGGSSIVQRTLRLNFAYRDGRWTMVDGTDMTAYRPLGNTRFSAPRDGPVTAEQLKRWIGPWRACMGPDGV